MILTLPQIRVLGALIEKEITTPDTYPLSLNALQAACNQRSSRDPVLDLSEDDLRIALHGLQNLGLAGPARGSLHAPAGRVAKFEHHARTALNLRRDEIAVLCLLLLRGPQTPGELRSRSDRLFPFDDLGAVLATLDRLAQAHAEAAVQSDAPPRPLVRVLARQPGSREARYEHLLGRPSHDQPAPPPVRLTADERSPGEHSLEDRITALEDRITRAEFLLHQHLAEPEPGLDDAAT